MWVDQLRQSTGGNGEQKEGGREPGEKWGQEVSWGPWAKLWGLGLILSLMASLGTLT